MSFNFIFIDLKNNNFNFNKNKNEMLELFKLSLGNGIINSKYIYIPEKYALSSKFIFKLKTPSSQGYLNKIYEIIYNKKLVKKNNAKMKYKTNENNKDIKIINKIFITNNSKRTKIIINNKKYDFKKKIKSKKIKVEFLDNIIYLNSMFKDCESLTSVFLNLKTKYLKTIYDLFYGCSSLLKIEDIFQNWKTDYINTNDKLYQRSDVENLPNISKCNISNVNDTSGIINEISSLTSLPDISNWNTSNIADMSNLFYKCSSLELLPDISKWNISNVIDISGLFDECSS